MSDAADQIIELYRRHAAAWAARRGSHLAEVRWFERFLSILPESPSVLDLGCGSGEPIGRYLVQNGCCVTGIDASPELIEIAGQNLPEAQWLISDMRTLRLANTFDGLVAWNSLFHLTPADQRRMFPVFKAHAANGAALIFTTGPDAGEAIGTFEGEALYHASLDRAEYGDLLQRNGFAVLDHVVEDPNCGGQTVWLAQAI